MLELWTVLLPILLTDVVNPVLFAFMVYAVGTERPVGNSVAALLGHTASYLSFGIGLAFAFEAITERLANPQPLDFGLGLVVGVLLLWVAWRVARAKPQEETAPQVERLTLFKAFGMGAIINIVGIPFALPYFAAIDQILKANLSIADSVMMLAGYNLIYALPFLIVPGLALALGEASQPVLARINDKLDRISAWLMPILLALVGLFLIADAVLYFSRGEGLF